MAEKYVDNKLFTAAIIDYNDQRLKNEKLGKKNPKMSDYIGKTIIDIANKLATKRTFANYTWKDAMIDEAITAMVSATTKFDLTKIPADKKPNALAYFTSVCNRAFLNRIAFEKKQLEKNDRIVFEDDGYRFSLDEHDSMSDFPNIHSNTDDLLSLHNKHKLSD